MLKYFKYLFCNILVFSLFIPSAFGKIDVLLLESKISFGMTKTAVKRVLIAESKLL